MGRLFSDGSSLVAQQVKALVLSLLWLGALLWCNFNPWLGTSVCHWYHQKEKTNKQKNPSNFSVLMQIHSFKKNVS